MPRKVLGVVFLVMILAVDIVFAVEFPYVKTFEDYTNYPGPPYHWGMIWTEIDEPLVAPNGSYPDPVRGTYLIFTTNDIGPAPHPIRAAGVYTWQPEFLGDYRVADVIFFRFLLQNIEMRQAIVEQTGSIYFQLHSQDLQGVWRYEIREYPDECTPICTEEPIWPEGWTEHYIIFQPTWTDDMAQAQGWIKAGAKSFQETLANVGGVGFIYEGRFGVSFALDDISINKGNIRLVGPNAHPTIDAAITEAFDGDVVLVEDGTYTVLDHAGIDLSKHILVRSVNGPANCIVDGLGVNRGFNISGLPGPLCQNYKPFVLSGFTIRNCIAGIWGLYRKFLVSNCIIEDNASPDFGGGATVLHSNAEFNNCLIRRNSAEEDGGGLFAYGSRLRIINCTFEDNAIGRLFQASGRGGGAFISNFDEPILVSGCSFFSNRAMTGAGIFCATNAEARFVDCKIIKNSGNIGDESKGGGIYYATNGSPRAGFYNCVIAGNSCSSGAGLYLDPTGGDRAFVSISNCTIFKNLGLIGAGLFSNKDQSFFLINSILRNGLFPDGFYYIKGDAGWCNIQGLSTTGWDGTNYDADPEFVDISSMNPLEWNLALRQTSPCIDYGQVSTVDQLIYGQPDHDLAGNRRILNGSCSTSQLPRIDTGAYEFAGKWTPLGSHIELQFPRIIIWFQSVDREGYSRVDEALEPPMPVPLGLTVIHPYCDIRTDAGYSGGLEVQFTYDESAIPTNKSEEDLRLFHLEGSSWVDVTSSIDVTNNVIRGNVSGLSWFLVGAPNQAPIADPGVDQGGFPVGADCMATVKLNGSASYDRDGDALSYAWSWDGGSATGPAPTVRLPIGSTTITLIVNDGIVNSTPAHIDIAAVDTALPTIQLSDPIYYKDATGLKANKLTITASDNCTADIVPSITEVKIYNSKGILIKGDTVFSVSGNDIYVYPNDGFSIRVTATAADQNGNTTTVTLSKKLIKFRR